LFSGDLHGLDTSMCFYHFIALVSMLCYLDLELICFLCVENYVSVRHMDGFLLSMVESILL